jgi:hypothetical protein
VMPPGCSQPERDESFPTRRATHITQAADLHTT